MTKFISRAPSTLVQDQDVERFYQLEQFAKTLGYSSVEGLLGLIEDYKSRPLPAVPEYSATVVRLKGEPVGNKYAVDVFLECVEHYYPIVSFQWDLLLDRLEDGDRARFLGIDKTDCLVSRTGWTVGCSLKTLRVGGFSSSLHPIKESGRLIRLLFDKEDEIELANFKLSGIYSRDEHGRTYTGVIDHIPELLVVNM